MERKKKSKTSNREGSERLEHWSLSSPFTGEDFQCVSMGNTAKVSQKMLCVKKEYLCCEDSFRFRKYLFCLLRSRIHISGLDFLESRSREAARTYLPKLTY